MSIPIKKSARNVLFSLPLLGYVFEAVWLTVSAPKQKLQQEDRVRSLLEKVEDSAEKARSNNDAIAKNLQDINAAVKTLNTKTGNISERQTDIAYRIKEIEAATPKGKLTKKSAQPTASTLLADNHSLDGFYIAFENKFRGPEKDIEDRLRVYVPYFQNLKLDFAKFPILDIGCGRGELLKVLTDNKIRCVGVDLNGAMVDRANEQGYEAIQADAIEYLMAQPAQSLSAICGLHIVEHIPFDVLLRLFEECHRVLKPGGFILFETPNPENINVGSFSFYYDPSHLHPIPPDLLDFAISNKGFDKTEVLRLHPRTEDLNRELHESAEVQDILNRFYGPQDYAVIGYK
jgi:O-antigen chain-terminating methyltransferase